MFHEAMDNAGLLFHSNEIVTLSNFPTKFLDVHSTLHQSFCIYRFALNFINNQTNSIVRSTNIMYVILYMENSFEIMLILFKYFSSQIYLSISFI